jgi:hypothetical protein
VVDLRDSIVAEGYHECASGPINRSLNDGCKNMEFIV